MSSQSYLNNRPALFGTSGVRGVVGQDLTEEKCRNVGRALGAYLGHEARVCLATDTRLSAGMLKNAVVAGLIPSGVAVTDLGVLPTPALALLTRQCGFSTGIMITASHNPPEFNGIKLFNADSVGYSADQEHELERIYYDAAYSNGHHGSVLHEPHFRQDYVSFVKNRFANRRLNRRLKVLVDPGNGAAAGLATEIFSELGLAVTRLNDEPDGRFPGRKPEPKEDTLQHTIEVLREEDGDLAVCFDGDADRVVFCDRAGFLGFNEMISYISRILIAETGKLTVATTVESGRLLDCAVKDLGATVVRGRVGDVPVARLARENRAAIGVEQVGVYILPEAGYYPDSILAALTLMSSISSPQDIRDFFHMMPHFAFEKKWVPCQNEFKEPLMDVLREQVRVFEAQDCSLLDGVRLEFADAWMLIRASGTEPGIRVLVEATSPARAEALAANGVDRVRAFLERVALRK